MCRCYFASYSSMGLKQFLNSNEYIGFWNHFYVLLMILNIENWLWELLFSVYWDIRPSMVISVPEIFQQTNKIVSWILHPLRAYKYSLVNSEKSKFILCKIHSEWNWIQIVTTKDTDIPRLCLPVKIQKRKKQHRSKESIAQ